MALYVETGYWEGQYAEDTGVVETGGPYVDIGYWEAGYTEDEVPVSPPIPDIIPTGTPILLPYPGEVRGATPFADPLALPVIYHRNPGPYSDELIFTVRTWAGHRWYGRKMPSSVINGSAIGRFATLIDAQAVAFTTTPLGNDLIGSIGMTESPRAEVTLDNRDGSWGRIVVTEPLLAMAAGHWLHFGGGDTHVVYQGQVSRIRLRRSQVNIETSEP